MLTSGGACAAAAWEDAAGGGATTFMGSDTSEASTTSTSSTGILSTSVTAIIPSRPFEWVWRFSKSTGAANTVSMLHQINASAGISAVTAVSDSANQAAGGTGKIFSGTQAETNNDGGGIILHRCVNSTTGATTSTDGMSMGRSTANITTCIIAGLVANASTTLTADELHVYAWNVS